MGQASAEEAGALQHAGDVVQRAQMGTEAHQPSILRANRHPARRTDGGAAGTAEGQQKPHRHLLAQLSTVGMGGQRD